MLFLGPPWVLHRFCVLLIPCIEVHNVTEWHGHSTLDSAASHRRRTCARDIRIQDLMQVAVLYQLVTYRFHSVPTCALSHGFRLRPLSHSAEPAVPRTLSPAPKPIAAAPPAHTVTLLFCFPRWPPFSRRRSLVLKQSLCPSSNAGTPPRDARGAAHRFRQ